ncbi:hypothetical protein ACIBFB_26535 [Nocardiopsis sp. NPDC050513]|uniref:hypothetical protein n=1 Tax=Nocardiopsis sp. NPDC050513 TaxID=3364338 RepID=UPI0037ADF7D8
MLLLDKVVAATGTTRADVLRVLNHGGTTRADWDIAHAIEDITGRSAYELMRTAGHDEFVAELWADARAETDQAPAPTNPHAEHDPQVVIYGENTAPDAPQTVLPDHPHDEDTVPTREEQAQAAHADLAHVLDDDQVAARLATKWASRISAVHQAAKQQVQQLLLSHTDPRIRRRAAYRARRARRIALAA